MEFWLFMSVINDVLVLVFPPPSVGRAEASWGIVARLRMQNISRGWLVLLRPPACLRLGALFSLSPSLLISVMAPSSVATNWLAFFSTSIAHFSYCRLLHLHLCISLCVLKHSPQALFLSPRFKYNTLELGSCFLVCLTFGRLTDFSTAYFWCLSVIAGT